MGECLAFVTSAVFVLLTSAAISMAGERQRNRVINFLCQGEYTLQDLRVALDDIDEQRMKALLRSLVSDGRVRVHVYPSEVRYTINVPHQELVR